MTIPTDTATIKPTALFERNSEEPWTVIKTKSRCEKKIAVWCHKEKLNYFLPQHRSIRHYKYRKVEFMKPMFPGYIFAQLSHSLHNRMLSSSHISRLIIPDVILEERLIQELNDLQSILCCMHAGTLVIRPEIQVGDPVLISSGVCAGLRGIVSRRRNQLRVTVNVDMIGYSVSIDIDVGELEREY